MFDGAANLTNIVYPNSPSVTFQFDGNNRLTNMVDAAGTTVYTYTLGNQLLTEDGPFASDTVTNTYVNRLRTALALQQPTGSWTNGFGWDAAKRLTNVISPAGTFSYTYVASLPSLLVRKLALPNTTYVTNNFDWVGRLLDTSLKNSGNTSLDSYAYVYDPANERTNLTRLDTSTVGFKYDKIGQLTVANSSVSTENRGYAYDSAWNLNYRTNNGTLKTFVVDNKNQLTNSPGLGPGNVPLSYDDNGNIYSRVGFNWWYDFDDENRMVNRYYYSGGVDGLGSPMDNSDLKTHFVYDGLGRLRTRDEYGASGSGPYTWVLVSECI